MIDKNILKQLKYKKTVLFHKKESNGYIIDLQGLVLKKLKYKENEKIDDSILEDEHKIFLTHLVNRISYKNRKILQIHIWAYSSSNEKDKNNADIALKRACVVKEYLVGIAKNSNKTDEFTNISCLGFDKAKEDSLEYKKFNSSNINDRQIIIMYLSVFKAIHVQNDRKTDDWKIALTEGISLPLPLVSFDWFNGSFTGIYENGQDEKRTFSGHSMGLSLELKKILEIISWLKHKGKIKKVLNSKSDFLGGMDELIIPKKGEKIEDTAKRVSDFIKEDLEKYCEKISKYIEKFTGSKIDSQEIYDYVTDGFINKFKESIKKSTTESGEYVYSYMPFVAEQISLAIIKFFTETKFFSEHSTSADGTLYFFNDNISFGINDIGMGFIIQLAGEISLPFGAGIVSVLLGLIIIPISDRNGDNSFEIAGANLSFAGLAAGSLIPNIGASISMGEFNLEGN